jgi:hypothetical protein
MDPTIVSPERPATIPEIWPGIFGVYKYSKGAVRFNLGTNVWLIIFSIVLGGANQAGLEDNHNIVAGIVAYLLGSLFAAALLLAQIASVRRTKLSFETAVKNAVQMWPKYIILSILLSVTYVVSLLLLIIPFLFIFPRLSLARYFLLDKRMGVLEAYTASWRATKGHILAPWNVIAGTALICLLAITIIGIPFSIYFYIMYSAALAVFYEMRLRDTRNQTQYVAPVLPQ